MKKPSEVKDWFSGNDPDQIEWAKRYWTNKGQPGMASRMVGFWSLSALEDIGADADGREVLAKMRRAWNTHKSKTKGERKTYSFVLSATADRQLRALAKGQSKSAVLEDLIKRGFEFEEPLRIERRKAIQQAVKEMKERRPLRIGPSLQEELAKRRAAELKEELIEQSEVLEFALHENCMLRVKLQDAGINPDGILNADQQLRARNEFETRLAWLNQDLKGRRRLARKPSTNEDEPKSGSR